METIKARGIIINEFLVGERDKSLRILIKDRGKFGVWAKNCRSSKSRLLASTSLFCYADFIINISENSEKKTMYINQAEIIENFYFLTSDLEKLSLATYLAEFTEKNIQDEQPTNDIMLLLLKSLMAFKNDNINPKLIARIFELKFLQFSGYTPSTSNCSHCGINLSNNTQNILGANGVICEKCRHFEYIQLVTIDNSILYILNRIISSEISNLFCFNVSNDILKNLELVNMKLMSEHMVTNLKSLEFLNSLEKF